MDFEQRLQRAIRRGEQQKDERGREAAQRELTEEEFRQLHVSARLELSERVEQGLRQLAEHFPGFRYRPEGWGGRITRDDFAVTSSGTKANVYSQMQMTISSFSEAHIVELAAKGTIRNKEVISRTHFQFLNKLDLDAFKDVIELWLLEYAELYAAKT